MARKRDETAPPAGGQVDEVMESPATVPLVEAATDRKADERWLGLDGPREKVTYSLPVRWKRLIDSAAGDLNMTSAELVVRLIAPALKGCSRPTIPKGLREQLGRKDEDAA